MLVLFSYLGLEVLCLEYVGLFLRTPSAPFVPPGLQSHMAALERDLVEEKERCRAEKQRRREIHNTLVVRAEITLWFSTMCSNCLLNKGLGGAVLRLH